MSSGNVGHFVLALLCERLFWVKWCGEVMWGDLEVGHEYPDSKVHGANMGPIWGRQDPSGPHVGPMNFAI